MKKLLWMTLLPLYLLKAGDPCPMSFGFYDTGVPVWLDREKILNELDSKEAWLGVSYRNTNGEGILVTKIHDSSPMQKAGIEVGDIIDAVDDIKVKTENDFSHYFDTHKLKKKMNIKVRRDTKKLEKTVVLGLRDPLLYALKKSTSKDCSYTTLEELTGKEKAAIHKRVISPLKRFDCKTAHEKLQKMKLFEHNRGQLVSVRGSKRVLLIHPHWGTVCVKSSDFDGDNLTKDSASELFNRLFNGYIEDRFENP